MEEKEIIVKKVIEEYGIFKLFNELGVEKVSQKGKNVYSACPMHGGDSPKSFSFSEEKGFGYCFSRCQRAYDLYDIVMKTKNVTFREALQFLADLVGYKLDSSYNPKYNNVGDENRKFLSQVKKASKIKEIETPPPFDEKILSSFVPKLHTFLRKEGFDEEVRDYFDLGFARDGYLQNRITIPIDDINGNIISVSGRLPMNSIDIDFMGEHKYKIWYNTDKGKTLYNISRASPYIDILKEVIVAEGFKSVWRLHQYQVDNVVATMGASLTEEQKIILLNLNCNIVVCGDNDDAGRGLNNQIIKGLGKFTNVSYIDMSLLNLPKSYSPAELTKEQWEYLYQNRKFI